MNKKFRTFQIKGIDEAAKAVLAYVSTFEWDRHGERFEKGAWDLENFKKNPVVLWAHDSRSLPIGKAVEIVEDEKGLLAKTVFNMEDSFAAKVFQLFKDGFLNSFSVGFIPKEFKYEDREGQKEKGFVITGSELLEYSAVSIPANPGAQVSKETAAIVKELMPDIHLKELDCGNFSVCKAQKDMPDFSKSLEYLMDLCKMEKGKKTLGDGQKALLKNAIEVLGEIHRENTIDEEVEKKEIALLVETVKLLAEAVKGLYGDPHAKVAKFMSQFDRALKTGRVE